MHTCNYLNHNFNPIIKYCLKDDCKSNNNKVCEMCWKEFHQDHQQDCYPISILYLILEIQINKLEQLIKQTQSTQKECDSFYQELIGYQDKFNKLIQNQIDENHIYQDIKTLIRLAKQCYNNEIQKSLIAFVWNQEIRVHTKNTIIKIIKQVFSYDDPQYLFVIITQQIEDLFYLCNYSLALKKINDALKIKIDYFLIAKKYSLFIIMGKHQEANQLLAQQYDYNFDNILQGQAFSLVNFHYYKKQHENDDRYNMQLFKSVSLLSQGKVKEAMKIVNAELVKNPESLDLILFYVKCLLLYHKKNKIDKAIRFCEQGMKNHPNCQAYSDAKFICMLMQNGQQFKIDNQQNLSDETKITYAIMLIKSGEFEKAIELLNSIQQNSKKYQEAQSFKFIAIKLFSKNKGNFPILSYEQHIQNSPIIAFISEMKQLFQDKRFQSALEIVEYKLLKIPNSLILNLLKSICLIALQNFTLAQQYLESLRIQYPNEPIIEISYAYCLVGLRQYQQALEIINNNPLPGYKEQFLELKGQIMFHQGQLNDSIGYFKQLQSNSNNIYLGLINHIKKQYAIAIYYYDKALNNETNNQQLLYNKALAILEKNITQKVQHDDQSYEEAKTIFKSLIDLYDSKWLLVVLYYQQNNYNEAHTLLHMQKKDYKNIEKAKKLESYIYYKQNLFGEVINIYQKSDFTNLNQNNISQFIISAILIKNYELAESSLNKHQQQLELLFYLFKGFLKEQQGKNLESSQYYQEFCTQVQSNALVSEYHNIIQAVKLAQRQLFIKLQQNQKASELENIIRQDYPNLPLNSNYQQLLINEFEIIKFTVKPILNQLETINLNLLSDFSKWIILIDKYDFMNLYYFELIFKQ